MAYSLLLLPLVKTVGWPFPGDMGSFRGKETPTSLLPPEFQF